MSCLHFFLFSILTLMSKRKRNKQQNRDGDRYGSRNKGKIFFQRALLILNTLLIQGYTQELLRGEGILGLLRGGAQIPNRSKQIKKSTLNPVNTPKKLLKTQRASSPSALWTHITTKCLVYFKSAFWGQNSLFSIGKSRARKYLCLTKIYSLKIPLLLCWE